METKIIQSEQDTRQYKIITLPNKLQVLLISDETAEKAAAGMNVSVGYFSDPDNVPGLAHFCEHMLFLGTKKFPNESEYNDFLASHGGNSNAYTDKENTNYFFDVNHKYLRDALDRFAQFFIDPLFTEDSTNRELNAVDSEHRKNLQTDEWRMVQLVRSSGNKLHPHSKFGTGNLETLKDTPEATNVNLRSELLKFHEKYYSANAMKLVILGSDPLETLESWATELFSGITNNDRVVDIEYNVPVYDETCLKTRFHVVPVKDLRTLSLRWILPPQQKNFRNGPTSYLSHLLGHEGPGSLLSLLKRQGYANELVSGLDTSSRDFSIFKVSIDLTQDGLEHVDDIVIEIYQYVKRLQSEGPQQWIFEECKNIAEIGFRFKDKEEPINYVSFLAGNLQIYPSEWVLAGPYLHDTYSPESISNTLKFFNQNNMILFISSHSFSGKTDLTEKWYNTQYSKNLIDDLFLQKCQNVDVHPELILPKINEFIATDFKMKSGDENNLYPILIKNTDLSKVWFKQDFKFKKPKINMFLTLQTPLAYFSPKNHVMTNLYTKLLQDSLNEVSYDADLAGLEYKLDAVLEGFQLIVRGYSHKHSNLVHKIIFNMKNFEILNERFLLTKETLFRTYSNMKAEQPYIHVGYNLRLLLEKQKWHYNYFTQAIQDVSLEDLKLFSKIILQNLSFEFLFVGNITSDETLLCVEKIESELNSKHLLDEQKVDQRLMVLNDNFTYLFQKEGPNPENTNTAIVNYYQIGLESWKRIALLSILCQIVKEPAFNDLRTKEQLGYIVFSGQQSLQGTLGFRILVQSERDPTYLDDRIEAFIETVPALLEKMTPEEWNSHVNALVAIKLEKDKTLGKEAFRYWNEIDDKCYVFDRALKVVAALKELKKEEVVNFWNEYLAKEAPRRRKLSVQLFGKGHAVPTADIANPNVVRITDVVEFKKGLGMFAFKPAL